MPEEISRKKVEPFCIGTVTVAVEFEMAGLVLTIVQTVPGLRFGADCNCEAASTNHEIVSELLSDWLMRREGVIGTESN